MWYVPQWLFWKTITVSHVCFNSINHSNGDKCTLNYCIYSSIWHFKFPKVVQAHILGEVGILGTVLLRVYSGTILTIFIEIGSYLTDREQKISWHSFFETRCRNMEMYMNVFQNAVESLPARTNYLVYDCEKQKLSGKASSLISSDE